ncbi:acyl-CoA dehydrogenase family protein [Dactylosporangium sp. NPDC005572]|uniref:acyl-CoA dehydrogenase family protein n=1 Tax=Dactylosporangium sp. NPDC005572 TaxID=3156889 RepID=UPI0033A47A41
MDFTLPEAALAVRDGVSRLVTKYPTEYWDRCDAEHRWPDELWADLGSGGWLGLAVPEEYGGGGQGLLALAVAMDAIATGGAGVAGAFVLMLTPTFGTLSVQRHGTAEQKAALLPGMATGKIQTCFALTEPDAGSDFFAMTTRAQRRGGDYVVRGQKLWTSGADRADWMILACRTAEHATRSTRGFTVLLVDVREAVAAGTLVLQALPKMSMNTVPSFAVFLDDVRVPADRVLGGVDDGFNVLWDVLNPERVIVAAAAVGAADLAVRLAGDYARTRQIAGRSLGGNQSVAHPLARVKAQTELARLMTHKAAWLWDRGMPAASEANIAKLTAAEAAFNAADRAVQTYGGMGFSSEHPVSRLFRDSRVMRTVPVSEELALSHIATQMLSLPRST